LPQAIFRRSAQTEKPPQGDSEHDAKKSERYGETCAVLQPVQSFAASLAGNKKATDESNETEDGTNHVVVSNWSCFRRPRHSDPPKSLVQPRKVGLLFSADILQSPNSTPEW